MTNNLPDTYDGDESTATDHEDTRQSMSNQYDETESGRTETTSNETTTATTGAMTGPQDESYDPIELYDTQRHRNGDETIVLLCSFAAGYQALALEVDAGGQLLATEEIGDDQDYETAKGMIKYWMQQNPKGILGGEAADADGFLGKLGFGGGES